MGCMKAGVIIMKVASQTWEISISEVIKASKLGGFLPEQAKGIFYIIKINIINLSTECAHLEGDLYLKDDQESLFKGTGLGVVHAEDFGLASPKQQISPGAETTIAAIYDVTPTATGLCLCWEPGWFTKPFVIDLQPYIKKESNVSPVEKQQSSTTKEQEKGFWYHYQKAHKEMYGEPSKEDLKESVKTLGWIFGGFIGLSLFLGLVGTTTSSPTSVNSQSPQAMTVCEKATMEWTKAATERDAISVEEVKSPWGMEKWRRLRDVSVAARLEMEKACKSSH